jgi:tetratricopeptide (TPR) repeat protein
MSLLMEALRKAEAAKNKADGVDENTDDSARLKLEPKDKAKSSPTSNTSPSKTTESQAPEELTETADALPKDESESESEIEQVTFELETRDEEAAVPEEESEQIESHQNADEIAKELLEDHEPAESYEFTMDAADELNYAIPEPEYSKSLDEFNEKTQAETLEALDKKVGGADELYGYIPEAPESEIDSDDGTAENIFEPLEAAEELSQLERSAIQADNGQAGPDQGLIDRQTASSLFQAKKNSQQSKRNRAIVLGALIALLPIGGGGFYWYYTNSVNSSSMFPATTAISTPPPGGFLGEVTPEPATEQNTPETNAVETVVDTALPVAEESPADEQSSIDMEAIAAVLEETETAADEATTEVALADDTPVTAAPPVLAGNNQPALNGNAASINTTGTPQPSVEIRLTRTTTSRAEVNPDLLAAYESFQQRDFEQARRLYSQVLDTQANNRDALLGLALINRQEGNIAQAQSLYSRLLQLNPRDPLARAGLLESGQNTSMSQQEAQLRALQNEYPNVAPLAFALGNLYASQARWNEAQNAYFDALLIARQVDSSFISPDYAFNLAVSLERLNQLALAYNYYQQALELSASSPAGFNMDNLNQRLAYLEQVLP